MRIETFFAAILAACCVGCSGNKALIGDWKAVTPSNATFGNFSFKPNHTVTSDHWYSPDHRSVIHYSGTWDLTSDGLTVTWLKITSEGVPKALTDTAENTLHIPQKGILDWEDANTVYWIDPSGGKQILKR